MPPFDPRQLPFLTREMLALGSGRTFQIIADVVAHSTEALEIRGFSKDTPFTHRFVPVGNSSIETFTFQVVDVPTMVSASVAPGGTDAAVAHVMLYLAVDGNRLCLLSSGLVGIQFGIAWPHQIPPTPPQKDGLVIEVTGTDPAADNEISDSVPANQIWELLGVRLRLVTDANAANRTVTLQIESSAGLTYRRAAGTVQTATQTQQYHFIPGGTTGVTQTNSQQEIALPPRIFLPAGSDITTSTANRQAGDNFNAAVYLIRRSYATYTS